MKPRTSDTRIRQPSVHGQKFKPNRKFLGTAEAYFVCHISPNFQISLIYAFTGCPQSVIWSIKRHVIQGPIIVHFSCLAYFWAPYHSARDFINEKKFLQFDRTKILNGTTYLSPKSSDNLYQPSFKAGLSGLLVCAESLRTVISNLIIYLSLSMIVSIKFIYSEKATKFCKTFTLLLTTVHTVKSKVKISQNFVAFSEYMNFTGSGY